ncbi:hypothetical protein D3C85_1148170 [compost metagenome]
MTHWRVFSLATPRSSPMCGRAGSMASIARAFIAIMMAIRQTNSANPGPLGAAAPGLEGEVVGALVIGTNCGLRQADATLKLHQFCIAA